MEQLKEYLDNLLSTQECSELEFKHAHGGFPGSFWETYSAFANTNGGLIIFGVTEKHNTFRLDPIDDSLTDNLLKTFWKQIKSKDCINLCLLSNDDIKIEKYGKDNIILFNIPRAPITDRPIYIGRDPLTGTFRRGHEGDYRCTPSEVHQVKAELTKRFGTDIKDINHNALTILSLALSENVTNEKLQYIIDAHRSDITRMLRELCRKGYLIAEGIGRGTHYKLATSINKDKAKDKVKDKVSRDKDAVITELMSYCTVWRKSSDMARHVCKSPKYISRSIIPEMLNLNILIREFHDVPTHPAQRYRIKPQDLNN